LKSLGLEKRIPKLTEHNINDPKVFYQLGAQKICSLIGIGTEGKKFRFSEKFNEV